MFVSAITHHRRSLACARTCFLSLCALLALTAASCSPVHSDMPLGTLPLGLESTSAFNGLWSGDGNFYLVTMENPEEGILRISRIEVQTWREGGGERLRTMRVLVRRAGTYLVLNELISDPDARYSWALVEPQGPDDLLVWTTNDQSYAFAKLILGRKLDGKFAEEEEHARSGFGEEERVRVHLTDITDDQLTQIIISPGSPIFRGKPLRFTRLHSVE